MYVPRPQDRRKRRVIRLVIAVVFTVVGLVFGWVAVDEARGGVVDAEVVGISYSGAGRRVYDVRFEVAGRVCSSRVDSGSKPKARDARIGGISRLRYSASDPCRKVRETIAAGPGPMPFIAAVVALGFWVACGVSGRADPPPTDPTKDILVNSRPSCQIARSQGPAGD